MTTVAQLADLDWGMCCASAGAAVALILILTWYGSGRDTWASYRRRRRERQSGFPVIPKYPDEQAPPPAEEP